MRILEGIWTLGLQAGGERKYSLSMPEVPE